MGMEQLKAELAQQMVILAGLRDQRQILDVAYFNAFAQPKPRTARDGIFKDRLNSLESALESTRNEIRAQIQAVYENTMSRQSYYAPILRLPKELMIQVFMLCWDSGRVPLNNCTDAINTLCLPWYLSGTCRIWREIAIDMACLWSNIALSFDASNTPSLILGIWIQRCNPHPASLYWLKPNGGRDVTIQPGDIQKLRFALKGIRGINIRTFHGSPAIRRMSSEQLTLHESALRKFQEGIDLLLHGHGHNLCKDMHELRWVAPRLSWDPPPLLLIIRRATNITRFTFALKEDPGLLRILSHMPHLEQANLLIPLYTRRTLLGMEAAQPVLLPSLRTLCVAARTFTGAAEFLHHLIAPVLRVLDMTSGPKSYTTDGDNFPPSELIQFLEQSHSNLQHLGIQAASNPEENPTSTLQDLFALENVKNSLRTCYIQAHHRLLSNPEEITALLGKMPNICAYRIGSAETAITFGYSLTQQMDWVNNILCEEESTVYFPRQVDPTDE